MAQKFKAGDQVKQIVPAPIAGEVAKFAFNEETGDVQFLVVWKDEDGVVHSHFFGEEQIELVKSAADIKAEKEKKPTDEATTKPGEGSATG